MEDEKYRIIVEATAVGTYEMKIDPPRFVWVNKEMCRILGYTKEELLQINPLDLTDEAGKRLFRERFRCQVAGEKVAPSTDFKVKTKDGKELWVTVHATFTKSKGVVDGALVFAHDITERKKAEIVCKKSEDKFRSLVERTSDWIWQTDQNNIYTYSSPKVKAILGYSPEEVVGKTPFDLMPKAEAKRVAKLFKEIIEKKKPFHSLENWIIHKNGSLVLLETSGVPLISKKGVLMGYRGIDRDITERRKAEDALRRSEERFGKIFHSNPAAIVISRYSDGLILDVNRTFLRLSGYKYEEVIGHTSAELKLFKNPIERNLIPYLLHNQGAISNLTMAFQTKNGEVRDALFSAEKIEIGNKECIISSVLDVTEHRKLERELEEYTKNLENIVNERTKKLKDAERLAAIGATAGMVGHDIRNPLQSILGDLYLIADDVTFLHEGEEKKRISESIESIRKNVDYIDKIVRDLQYFAIPLKPIVKEIDLDEIFRKVLFKKKLPENIDAKYVVGKGVGKIFSDATLVKRILSNLTINAVQAMPEGGKLLVSANRNGDEVVIAVKDTGVGIPKEVRPNLFKPLFSTKAKGQGFGLAVVKRMTETLGGTVTYKSKEGKGTKFTVHLPAPKKEMKTFS